ncbi:MAG: GTPase Era [Bacteroidota bacterium]
MNNHKAGFISLLGLPNAGKSTLMNALVGERLSIITPKAQTTRHRIIGILSGDGYQLVFSDTPGYLESAHGLHQMMMRYVDSALKDADIVLLLVDVSKPPAKEADPYRKQIIDAAESLIVLFNKTDLLNPEERGVKLQEWRDQFPDQEIMELSAVTGAGKDELMQALLSRIPECPAYYDPDELTDKSERFIAAEIIREKIFLNYRQEVPYSTEVMIERFKDDDGLLRIEAMVYVERESQKGIIIGAGGSGLKTVGTEARKDMEAFWQQKIFLTIRVKVRPNWRNDPRQLRYFGYSDKS